MNHEEELVLLGAALLAAQKFEFALYAVTSTLGEEFLSRFDRLKGLTAESFLRGDLDDHRATLGQLVKAVGDRLLLASEDLDLFVRDRNILAHRYWRMTHAVIRDGERLADPKTFLLSFGTRCDQWTAAVRGLLWFMSVEAAKREGRMFAPTEAQLQEMAAYESRALAWAQRRGRI